ncbi:hypothetical protein B0H10DRAFT_2213659 [Mycena sp. CBHHK59/15]|nr:hypothetical protein B0H10DRAFT_2213659 [Mycena sp. CBHHK59/15]
MSGLTSLEPQTLSNTLGAVFMGVVLSCILFGVSTLQVYWYYHWYPHDGILHKGSVGLLWALDAIHLSLTIYSTYHYGVLGFGDVLASTSLSGLSSFTPPSMWVVIVLVVQSLYAYRVWLLGGYHHGVLGYLVTAVVLGGFGIGIVLAYETYTLDVWTDVASINWALESSFAASTAIDVVISITMCFYLRKSKGSGSLMNSRISTLMQYTLSCGVFTSACSLACLFTFILMPNNLIFLALTYILTRLYVNSFIAMMNARQRIPPNNDTSLALSNHISSAAFTFGSPQSAIDHESPPQLQARLPKAYEWIDMPRPPIPHETRPR